MRLLLLVIVGLFCLLQYRLWYADGSFVHNYRLNEQVEAQRAENATLKERNEQLEARVDSLRGGDEVIEALARSELGLVKEGESFYQVVEPEPAASREEQAESSQQ